MANLFTVTTTTNTLRLKDREGEVTFTVSNTSGRPVRGRALLQPEDPEAAGWVRLEGEGERDFPEAGTERYTVQINAPSDAPAGSYAFRLDMVGVERPDEDYTRGQTVTFEVPEAEPKTEPFPVWKALVAVGVLLLGVVIWQVVTGDSETQVPVPDVSGSTIEDARAAIERGGLRIGQQERQPDDAIGADLVIGTDPPANRQIVEGSSVSLIISTGPAEFDVVLTHGIRNGDLSTTEAIIRGLALLAELSDIMGIPASEIGPLIEDMPVTIKEGVLRDEAEEIKSRIEEHGAGVELR